MVDETKIKKRFYLALAIAVILVLLVMVVLLTITVFSGNRGVKIFVGSNETEGDKLIDEINADLMTE